MPSFMVSSVSLFPAEPESSEATWAPCPALSESGKPWIIGWIGVLCLPGRPKRPPDERKARGAGLSSHDASAKRKPSALPLASSNRVRGSGGTGLARAPPGGPRPAPWGQGALATGELHLAPSSHHVEKVQVGLAGLHLLEHELHRLDLVHRIEQLAQDPRLLQDLRLEQHLLAARARAVDLDGRVHPLLGPAAIEVALAI